MTKINYYYCIISAGLDLVGRPLFLFWPMGTFLASSGGLVSLRRIANPITCLHI
jgi:hypothetical protein